MKCLLVCIYFARDMAGSLSLALPTLRCSEGRGAVLWPRISGHLLLSQSRAGPIWSAPPPVIIFLSACFSFISPNPSIPHHHSVSLLYQFPVSFMHFYLPISSPSARWFTGRHKWSTCSITCSNSEHVSFLCLCVFCYYSNYDDRLENGFLTREARKKIEVQDIRYMQKHIFTFHFKILLWLKLQQPHCILFTLFLYQYGFVETIDIKIAYSSDLVLSDSLLLSAGISPLCH